MIALGIVLGLLVTVMALGVLGMRMARDLLAPPEDQVISTKDPTVVRDAHRIRRMLAATEKHEKRRVDAVCAGYNYRAAECQEKYDFIMSEAEKLAKKHKMTVKQLSDIGLIDPATGKVDTGEDE